MRARRFLALALCICFGCDGGPRTYTVSGKVTLDGEAIPVGHILFIPEDRALRTEGGPIRNGDYSFQARAGRKRVEITASRQDPNAPTAMGPTYVDYIPQKYNVQSKLKVEVSADRKNEFDFPLDSNGARP
jgi:hypothetical protein